MALPPNKNTGDSLTAQEFNDLTSEVAGKVDTANASSALVTATGSTTARTLAAWQAQLVAAQTELWQSATKNFIFEGDSNMAGGVLPAGQDWVTQVMLLPQFAGRGTKNNVALGGDKIADIVSQYAATVYPLRPAVTGKIGVLFVAIGTNDMGGATSAADLFTALSGYWTTAKADGFTVVAFTIPGVELLGLRQTVRQTLNKMIRASSAYDFLVDLDAYFPDPWDTTVYLDGTHFNQAGALKVAALVNAVMSLPGRQAATATNPYQLYPIASGYLRVGPEKWPNSGTIRIPNGAIIAWRNAANDADYFGIYVAVNNQLIVGSGVVSINLHNSTVIQGANADANTIFQLDSGLTGAYEDYITLADRTSPKWDIRKPADNSFLIYDRAGSVARVWLTAASHSLYRVGSAGGIHKFQNSAGTAELVNIPALGGVQPGALNAGGVAASAVIYSGTGVPSDTYGANGDFFFRTDTPGTANQRLYVKSAGAWAGIL